VSGDELDAILANSQPTQERMTLLTWKMKNTCAQRYFFGVGVGDGAGSFFFFRKT
jgi:hypothetical protein